MAEVLVLMVIMESTNYNGWTKNRKGWDLLKAGMTGMQAKACKPSGVTFEDDGTVTKIDLSCSGLTGKFDAV
jgi:hypothetical protein